MLKQATFKLILNTKEFLIPSNFPFLNDVNPEVYRELISNGKYEVKSNVSDKIFQNFVNNWTQGETLAIDPNNFGQYNLLSKEFDRMTNCIQLFVKHNKDLFQKQQSIRFLKDKIQYETEKYQKIIQILMTNFQFIKDDIKAELLNQCKLGNIESVIIFTSKKVFKNGLIYILNTDKTAEIICNYSAVGDIFIPKSIEDGSQEYVIIGIYDCAFQCNANISSIQFPKNSQLQFIGKKAFFMSSLQKIFIPSSVKKIESDSFSKCLYIQEFEFSENSQIESIDIRSFFKSSVKRMKIPSNIADFKYNFFLNINLTNIEIFYNKEQIICYYNNSLILGKTKENQENFDILLYAQKNVKNVTIPSSVKFISTSSFYGCKNLEKVEFAQDSELIIIGNGAFCKSSLERIFIPLHVKKIYNESFSLCKNLKEVIFDENSELEYIGSCAFQKSSIKNIIIPSSVTQIDNNAFDECVFLQNVTFAKQSILKSINKYSFQQSQITNICIPSSVKIIDSFAFFACSNLRSVEFMDNSELTEIGSTAFAKTSIVNICIPQHVKHIKYDTFAYCKDLQKVEFSKNSELITIEEDSFRYSTLNEIIIPSSVDLLDSGWINEVNNLMKVTIIPNKIQNITFIQDSVVSRYSGDYIEYNIFNFASRAITEITLPSTIQIIASNSFQNCNNLKKVTFLSDSQLKIIGKFAFANTGIKSIFIPSHVTLIDNCSFYSCKELEEVDFCENSELVSIGSRVFTNSGIEKLSIPSSIKVLNEGWSCNTPNLIHITIVPSLNPNIDYYNDTLIIGKSNPNQSNFDSILFLKKDVRSVTIPSFIKYITSYSFCESQLEYINFEEGSELILIGKVSFAYTSVREIEIPSGVTEIHDFAFSDCSIEKIVFHDDSKLTKIGDSAFSCSLISCISIPKHVVKIEKEAFCDCELKLFEIMEDSELEYIDNEMFTDSFDAIIMIPVNFKGIINF